MQDYFKRLNFDDLVIIATKENPQIYLPARVLQIIEKEIITKHDSTKTFNYNVQTDDYEKNPFENFYMTDDTFLTWEELSYFGTIKEFKENQLYFINKYLNK